MSISSKGSDDRSIEMSDVMEIDTSAGPLTMTLVLSDSSVSSKKRIPTSPRGGGDADRGRASMTDMAGRSALAISFEGIYAPGDTTEFAQIMAAFQHMSVRDGEGNAVAAVLSAEPLATGGNEAVTTTTAESTESVAERVVSDAMNAALASVGGESSTVDEIAEEIVEAAVAEASDAAIAEEIVEAAVAEASDAAVVADVVVGVISDAEAMVYADQFVSEVMRQALLAESEAPPVPLSTEEKAAEELVNEVISAAENEANMDEVAKEFVTGVVEAALKPDEPEKPAEPEQPLAPEKPGFIRAISSLFGFGKK